MLKQILEKLKEWPCNYSDGKTKSNCPYYNLSDIFDPEDD